MLKKLERLRDIMVNWGGADMDGGELYGEHLSEAYGLVLELIEAVQQDEAENKRLLEEAYISAW